MMMMNYLIMSLQIADDDELSLKLSFIIERLELIASNKYGSLLVGDERL